MTRFKNIGFLAMLLIGSHAAYAVPFSDSDSDSESAPLSSRAVERRVGGQASASSSRRSHLDSQSDENQHDRESFEIPSSPSKFFRLERGEVEDLHGRKFRPYLYNQQTVNGPSAPRIIKVISFPWYGTHWNASREEDCLYGCLLRVSCFVREILMDAYWFGIAESGENGDRISYANIVYANIFNTKSVLTIRNELSNQLIGTVEMVDSNIKFGAFQILDSDEKLIARAKKTGSQLLVNGIGADGLSTGPKIVQFNYLANGSDQSASIELFNEPDADRIFSLAKYIPLMLHHFKAVRTYDNRMKKNSQKESKQN